MRMMTSIFVNTIKGVKMGIDFVDSVGQHVDPPAASAAAAVFCLVDRRWDIGGLLTDRPTNQPGEVRWNSTSSVCASLAHDNNLKQHIHTWLTVIV